MLRHQAGLPEIQEDQADPFRQYFPVNTKKQKHNQLT